MVDAVHSYKTLLAWTHTGALAADATASSQVELFGDDEAYQIHKAEIFAPYAGPLIENVLIEILMNGDVVDTIKLDSRMGPPFAIGYPTKIVTFGDRKSVNPLENTCLKGRTKLQVRAMGLLGGVTGDFSVRLSGDYFKKDEALVDLLGPTFAPDPITVVDVLRGKSVSFSRPVPISLANWTNMTAGAHKASKPRVMPYIRFARNYAATVVNTEFRLRHEDGNTKYDWESMSWDLDAQTALIFEALGVEPDSNQRLKNIWFEFGGVEYPKDRYDARYAFNELPMGAPASGGIIQYQGPRILEKKFMATNELAEVRALDNGVSIPAANPFLVALWAKLIEL